MGVIGQAIVQNIVDGQRDIQERDGVAAVAVVVRQPFDDAPCALTQVAAHPVVGGRNLDLSFGRDAPVGVVHEVRRGHHRLIGPYPGIPLGDVHRDAKPLIQLTVLLLMPRRQHAERIFVRGMGVVKIAFGSGPRPARGQEN